jgi:pilus assembly protein CpaB
MSVLRFAMLGLAIGSAGLAAYLSKDFLNQEPQERIVEVNKVATTEVLIMSQDVRMGDRLSPAHMTWQAWPSDNVRNFMISRNTRPAAVQELESARARSDLFEGEPVSDRKVILPDSAGFMAAILPKGMRAISVRISAESGAGGFILPNDRVDVILITKESVGSGSPRTVSEVVLTNVRVLAIDQTFQTNDKGQQVVVGKTATVELDPKQAEILAKVESSGQLTLALRSLADRGDSALGDDGPRLAERFITGGGRGNEISVFRYGIHSQSEVSK